MQIGVGQTARLGHHPRVVRVRHRHAAVAERVEQLSLRVRHAVDGPHPFQVHRGHVGDDGHVRVRPLREPRDLAQVVHAAFDGGVAVLLAEPQERERNADFVVEVALGLEGRSHRGEHLRDQLLGAGLSGRAGDADQFEIWQPAPPAGGQASERAPRVRRREDRDALRPGARLGQRIRRDQDAGSATLHRLGDEVAAVEVVPAQGDEQATRHRLARVGERALEGTSGRGDLRASRPGGLLEREARSAHREISSSARLASARSSNGRFSLPTIW